MIDINIYESQTCKTVSFGRKGENLARRILFDLSALIAEFGTGSFEWVIRRPHESTVYIAVNKEQDGNTAILNLTATETAISGYGGLELRYYVDDVIVKTIVWRTSIAASLGTNEVPEPIEDYIDRMREIANEASESADAAGDSATQAAVSAANAANSATEAAGHASNAAASASASADSATDSAASASAAHTSEVNAANSASLANGSATQAAGSASAASDSASAASGSAAAAAQSATQAANSATQAAQSATAASSSAQDIAASSAQIETNRTDIADLKNELSQNAIPIVNSASGAIASFSDGADDVPVRDLVVNIEPVQSGSGDPSPDNVRQISGWTGMNVYRQARNYFNIANVYDAYKGTGGTSITIAATGTFRDFYTGTSSNSAVIPTAILPKLPFLKAGTYRIFYTIDTDPSVRPYMVNSSTGAVSSLGTIANGQPFTLSTDSLITIRKAASSETATFTDFRIVRDGDSTDYEPYSGQTYSVDWTDTAGTVYGGTLDVTTGVLTVESTMLSLNGTEDDSMYSVGSRAQGYIQFVSLTDRALPTNSGSAVEKTSKVMSNCLKLGSGGAFVNRDNNTFTLDAWRINIQLFKGAETAPTKQEIKDAIAALGGIDFVYLLETPHTYQLTPTEVKTLLGLNNIFADTGDIASVDYVADTKTYIDAKTSAAQKLMELIVTANREDSMTASANYSIGDLIIVAGTLYKATAAIASGATMTAGTNVAQTTIAAELAALA